MSVTSIGSGKWSGTLKEGAGSAELTSSGAGTFPMTWNARADGVAGATTPEELLGAAHAACFAMALSNVLGEHGYTASAIDTTSAVTFVPGRGVVGIELNVDATVPGIGQAEFDQITQEVSAGCPVSVALAAVPITLVSSTLR